LCTSRLLSSRGDRYNSRFFIKQKKELTSLAVLRYGSDHRKGPLKILSIRRELVAWRIKNFASVVGRENVIAGTDCGFAQSYNIVRCHPSVQWAKLEALVEGAQLASQELWKR
jgi:hypothetical protein